MGPVLGRGVGIAIAVAVASIGRMGASSTFGLLAWTIGGAAASTLLAAVLLRLLDAGPQRCR